MIFYLNSGLFTCEWFKDTHIIWLWIYVWFGYKRFICFECLFY